MSVHSFSLVPAAYVLLLRQAPGRASDPAPATAAIALAGTSRPRPDVPAPLAGTISAPTAGTVPASGASTVPAPLAGTVPPGTAAPRSPGSPAAGTEVLLQLRRNTGYMDGYWATGAAGHVESGESVLQTACREAREEVGVVLTPEDLSPLTAMHRSNDVGGAAVEQRVDFFFTARTWQGTPTVQEHEKDAGLSWFPLTALPALVPAHERAVLTWLARALDGGEAVPAITTFGFTPGQDIAHYGVARH